jgi:hypothetical protein
MTTDVCCLRRSWIGEDDAETIVASRMRSLRYGERQPQDLQVVWEEIVMHSSTYEYLKPTDDQIELMTKLRDAAKVYGDILEAALPEGPDKTFVIRMHRSNAMWVNVAITRLPDGTPRT